MAILLTFNKFNYIMIQHIHEFKNSPCKKYLTWKNCWRPFFIAFLQAFKDYFCFTFLGTGSHNLEPKKVIPSVPKYTALTAGILEQII